MESNSKKTQDEQSTSNTSTLTAGEKFWLELKAMPYSNDRVGQVEIINFSGPLKKTTKPIKDGTEK